MLPAACCFGSMFPPCKKIGNQSGEVGGLDFGIDPAAAFVRIEVAVRALLQTPRQMHIQRERRQAAERQRAGAHEVLDVLGH